MERVGLRTHFSIFGIDFGCRWAKMHLPQRLRRHHGLTGRPLDLFVRGAVVASWRELEGSILGIFAFYCATRRAGGASAGDRRRIGGGAVAGGRAALLLLQGLEGLEDLRDFLSPPYRHAVEAWGSLKEFQVTSRHWA